MQPTTNYLHFFLFFIFCFPCSFLAFGTTADAVVVGGEKIVRANWTSYMSHGFDVDITGTFPNIQIHKNRYSCIQPDQNQSIEIILSYDVQDAANIDNYPAIHLRYTISENISLGNQSVILNEVISFDDMTQIGNNFSQVITVNFSQNSYSFNYNFELLTPSATSNFVPYPIDDYPNLFVEYEEQNVFPFNNKTVLSGWKRLCGTFYSGVVNPEPFPGLNGFPPIVPLQSSNTSTIEAHSTKNRLNPMPITTLNLQAYPNPFSNQLHLDGNITENTTIKLFDTQGELIYYKKNDTFTNDSPKMIDTSSFPPGMYYCQIKNNTSSQTIKIIKQ